MTSRSARTVWVLGDQLHRDLNHLRGADPADTEVLFVVSRSKLRSAPWHRQRLHLILSAMRRFANELEAEGFAVDWRVAETMSEGVRAHFDERRPDQLRVMEPMNRAGAALLDRLSAELPLDVVPGDQFLCSRHEFAEWADGHVRRDGSLLMEDFYRWQRRRLNVLIDGDGEPVGGRWNFDDENRLPPPKHEVQWPDVAVEIPDEVDEWVDELLSSVEGLRCVGAPSKGLWAADRAGVLKRLDHFIDTSLAGFGPYEDAIIAEERFLNHSILSPYLNLGLIHPKEVVARVLERTGDVPLNSLEGFIRQIIGWREYVYGLYWWFGEDYLDSNVFDDDAPVPPSFLGEPTDMNCVAHVARWVDEDGWTHHIPRLMVLANLATLAGVRPHSMLRWMWASFVDGAEWVMAPNILGMGMYADGGRMSTKPYVSGGNYLSKMTNFCGSCVFDKKERVGEHACPFTTLYWDFLDRNRESLRPNHRMARMYANLDRLADLDEVRARAVEVRQRLRAGTL